MKRYWAILLCAFGLPLADAASAGVVGNWLLSRNSNAPRPAILPQQWVTWEPTAAGDDSPVLDVSACDNVDIKFWDDKAGNLTDSTETYHVKVCSINTRTSTLLDGNCEAMDGVPALTTDVSGGPTVGWLWIDGVGGGSNVTSGIFRVQCN